MSTNNTNPTVSVVMITYGHERFIRAAVEGILNQCVNFEVELIIADDNSNDNTANIVNDLALSHPHGHWIKYTKHKNNKGMISNLLWALERSNGIYLALCDGDDYWIDVNKLQKQVGFLNAKPEISLVFTNRKIQSIDGAIIDDLFYSKDVYTTKDLIEGFIPGTQTMTFRNHKNFISLFRNYEYIYSGDRYLAYFCSLTGPIYKMEDVTAVYRFTNSGIWNSYNDLEKLHYNYSLLRDFHLSLGIPLNNEILCLRAFDTAVATFTYCLRRPYLFFQWEKSRFVFTPFWEFFKMNGIFFLILALKKRISK
jgi:glycosyltransferase involved in cell wall biosynthesis